MRSIERQLLGWILGGLTLGALLIVLVTYLVTLDEMSEVFDAELRNVAQALAAYHHSDQQANVVRAVSMPRGADAPVDMEIAALIWSAGGVRVYGSDPTAELPFTRSEGFSRPVLQGEEWIVYTSVNSDSVTQAAQKLSARQEMAVEAAAKLLPPLIGMVLVVGGLLVFGLRRGLQPLHATAEDIAARSARSLEPIEARTVPRELAPLVASTNGLMARLAAALSSQRRFIADAAHEMRTPITALRLQLQLLDRSTNETERRQAAAELAAGIERAQRLIEQLLQFARADADAAPAGRKPVDLAELVRAAVAGHSAEAVDAGLDLGAVVPASLVVDGHAEQLAMLLDNLIGNAIRYTPVGGVIDVEVRLDDGHPVVSVTDTGPGIPEAERERVFERFYRGTRARECARDGGGSGLGLAIVKTIAERHGARVSLGTPAAHQGLEVRVTFPAAPA